jgi:O-antigen/teichoic acid export membrane protein
MLVSMVLPPFLVHHLSHAAYSAWVLILQLSAYVNLLDLGMQTAIAKFVAEHHAAGEEEANHRLASTTFTILTLAAIVGALATAITVWQVPHLFTQMPRDLIREMRLGLFAVGISTCFGLPFNTFPAAFTGLQRYGFPTILAVIARVASAVALILVLLLHCTLAQLAFVLAGFNVLTAIGQYFGWRKYLKTTVPFSFFSFDRDSAGRLTKYGSVLTIWTLASLLMSGFDTVIVGHYDFNNTGFYGVASSATNFLLILVANTFGPLMPAVSSIQASATSERLGDYAIRTTRYCVLMLCLLGLPLIFGAYPLLKLWVGHTYAINAALFLQVLVIGNMIRQVTYPYAIFVVATGKQYLATLSGVAEAAVNFALSIWLAHRIGALGVAIGTLAGAFVGVALHLTVSMHFTRSTILIRLSRFLAQGILRPLLCVIPSLLLYPWWRRYAMLPASPLMIACWMLSTLVILWQLGLSAEERGEFRKYVSKAVAWVPAQ